MLIFTSAKADPWNFSWTIPTARTDNTALALTDLKEARLYRTGTPGKYDTTVFFTLAPTQTSGTDNVAAGVTLCHYVTYVDTSGLESDPSNEICHTGIAAKPSKSVMTSK